MKKKKEPKFQNAEDPDAKSPEVTPPAVQEIVTEDDERTIALKQLNISEADILFVKELKGKFSANSDESAKLWSIHLNIFGRWPQPDDRFCSACISKCMSTVWTHVEPYYSKYLIK